MIWCSAWRKEHNHLHQTFVNDLRKTTYIFGIAFIVGLICISVSNSFANSWVVRWYPLSSVFHNSEQVVRVRVVEYGPVIGLSSMRDGITPSPLENQQRYEIYEWVKLRVLGKLKGECVNDSLTLFHDPNRLSDRVTESNYTVGSEYLLFLRHCDRKGPTGHPYGRFEYSDGMVTGRIYSIEIETVSIAQFREELKP